MTKFKKCHVYFTGICGLLINLVYALIFFVEIISGGFALPEKQVLISALSLEISWVFIFIWFIKNPGKRRGILLISLIPMIIANILNTMLSESLPALLNIFVLLIFCLVFTAGYFFADEFKVCKSKGNINEN
jgi:hypothetical protein